MKKFRNQLQQLARKMKYQRDNFEVFYKKIIVEQGIIHLLDVLSFTKEHENFFDQCQFLAKFVQRANE